MSAISLLELAIAAGVLWMGAGGGRLVLLLSVWVVIAGALLWRYARQRARWTDARLALTHDAVEQMTGHRTRLAQEPVARRHSAEDDALETYHSLSIRNGSRRGARRGVDRTGLVARGNLRSCYPPSWAALTRRNWQSRWAESYLRGKPCAGCRRVLPNSPAPRSPGRASRHCMRPPPVASHRRRLPILRIPLPRAPYSTPTTIVFRLSRRRPRRARRSGSAH
jgi:hypothetical protein